MVFRIILEVKLLYNFLSPLVARHSLILSWYFDLILTRSSITGVVGLQVPLGSRTGVRYTSKPEEKLRLNSTKQIL